MNFLEECRKRIGPPPRSFSPELTREIRGIYWPLLSTHPWDSLMRTFFHQTKIRERGEVVWAQVLQANEFLFNPGLNGESHPATILHAGPELEDPSLLSEMADQVVSLQGTGQKDPDTKAAEALMHPSRRKYWAPVPESIAGKHEVFCSDILIFRKLLPQQPTGATLQKPFFPLLVARDQTRVVMQVPSHFWPEDFVDFWESK